MGLQEIKNQVAIEAGYESFDDYMRELIRIGSVYSVERLNKIIDEICMRAQKEALGKAANRADVINDETTDFMWEVDLKSITNPENLIR